MLRIIRVGMAAGFFLIAAAAQAADVKVTGVYNCCGACKAAITKALTDAGATNVTVDKGDVAFSADDAVKAVTALNDAGFAGKVEGATVRNNSGARGVKGTAIKVEKVHNCCGKCVQDINNAVKAIGTTDAKARESSFTVTSTSEVEARAVVKALRDAGFNAHVKQ
jgi:copper chaperone CopZ